MRLLHPLLIAFVGLLLLPGAGFGQGKADISTKTPSELGGKTLAQWVKEILDQDPSVRENAIRTVILFGKDAQKAAGPNLITELRDGDVSCKLSAAVALGLLGIDQLDKLDKGKAINGLDLLLRDQQTNVKYQAAMAIGRIGPDCKGSIDQLANYTLTDRQCWEIRRAAAFALGRVAHDEKAGPDPRAVKALVASLGLSSTIDPKTKKPFPNESCAQVRFECVMSLGLLGAPRDEKLAVSIAKALEGTTSDRDKTVQVWSHVLLREIAKDLKDSKTADLHLEAIGKYLKADELVARTHAAEAIGSIGSEAKSLIPGLIELLRKDKELIAIAKAIFVLASFGPDAKEAIPHLEALKKHEDEDIKYAADYAIDKIKKPVPKKP